MAEKLAGKTHREPLFRRHLDHAPEKVLTVGGHKVGDVEHASLDLLQELPQVVVVEGKGPDEEGVQDDAAGPHVGPGAVVTFSLQRKVGRRQFGAMV